LNDWLDGFGTVDEGRLHGFGFLMKGIIGSFGECQGVISSNALKVVSGRIGKDSSAVLEILLGSE
jgi:hypothetical protein